jgi:HEAT repeat protein
MAPVVSGEAADAIRHIGTNALPLLVRWIQEPQDIPFWKVSLYSRVYRWNFQHPGRAELLEILIGRQMRPDRALSGFTILGLDARPAIPDLVQIVHSQTNASARYATSAMAYLGKDALTPLLNLATNQSSPLQGDAMVALGQMRYLGSEAHPAIMTLLDCLDDPKLGVGAADILGRLHLEGGLCVPALARCTESTNQTLRMWGAISLGRFGNPAKPATAKLTVLLNDPDQDVRDSATNALLIIAPETAELQVGAAR